MSRNLAEIVAAADSGRTALHVEGHSIPYSELDRRARSAAALLRERGVGPGDRVALLIGNGAAFVAAWLGTLRLGAIVVPLNPLLAAPEVEARVAASGARLLLREDELEERPPLADLAAREAGDPAVILYTSGTSGRPKGAILTHGGIHVAARNAADALALGPDDVMLGAAPFSHVLGQSTGLVSTFLAGAAVAVVRRFEAEQTLAAMTATRTTILLGVPAMCIALCQAARSAAELPPVRIAHVGGAAVPVEVARDFERTFGGEVFEGYGLTELSGIATTYVQGQPRKPGSVGMPLGGTDLRIGELGEVQFRGPSVIPGYWEDPAATAEAFTPDGWLRTGDVGRLDEDGYLFLVDRLKELIVRGGYNVFPREVEEALYAHPAVLEAAVVGVPHETLGEEVAALVVLRPGASADADKLREWTRARVAAYKYPRRIVLVDELPKGPTGKILKRAIDRSAL
ncbi:MAG: class I adenylate-forming enzyme family protein [Gaiellaceae bacterium]